MVEAVIGNFKHYIDSGSLESCQEYLTELTDTYESGIPWEYVFQKVYLHACLKKQKPIVDWLMLIFNQLDPIQQIGIRQVFAYGRTLLARV
jgi:hypothetical protein